MNADPLNEYEESLLRYVQSDSPTEADVEKEFAGILSSKEVRRALGRLKLKRYIKIEQHLASGIYSIDQKIEDMPWDEDYVLTPLGKNYLANITANFTSFSNINNSNIAHQSPGAAQSIRISDQPLDIREKIKELELAAVKQDGTAMKKAFGYIADKAVDVAIAPTTGALLK